MGKYFFALYEIIDLVLPASLAVAPMSSVTSFGSASLITLPKPSVIVVVPFSKYSVKYLPCRKQTLG